MTKEAEFTVLGKWLIPEILRFLWPLRLLNQWGVKFMSQAPNFRTIQAGVTWPTSARTKGEKVALTLHHPSQVKIASCKEQHEEDGWDLENSRIWGGRQGKKSHPFASKLPQKCGQAKNIPGCHRQPISPQVFCIACFLGIFQRNLRIYNLSQRDVLCSPI